VPDAGVVHVTTFESFIIGAVLTQVLGWINSKRTQQAVTHTKLRADITELMSALAETRYALDGAWYLERSPRARIDRLVGWAVKAAGDGMFAAIPKGFQSMAPFAAAAASSLRDQDIVRSEKAIADLRLIMLRVTRAALELRHSGDEKLIEAVNEAVAAAAALGTAFGESRREMDKALANLDARIAALRSEEKRLTASRRWWRR
jgi:hypothetical protein